MVEQVLVYTKDNLPMTSNNNNLRKVKETIEFSPTFTLGCRRCSLEIFGRGATAESRKSHGSTAVSRRKVS